MSTQPLIELDFMEACDRLGWSGESLRKAARVAALSRALRINMAAQKSFIKRMPKIENDRAGYMHAREALTVLFGEHAALIEELGRDD